MMLLLSAPATFAAAEEEVFDVGGLPGTARYKAKINFRALAEYQKQRLLQWEQSHIQLSNPPPRAIHEPMPPWDRNTNDPPESSVSRPEGGTPNAEGTASAQSIMALAQQSPAPASSFPALEDNLTVIPPDTHGAVGPNHLMVTLNSQIRIQDRQGTILSTMDLNTFWSPLGFPDAFDPKVLFDPHTGRFFVTACADRPLFTTFFNNSSVLLAVSETSDPTGNWFLYSVLGDATGTTWADYPSFGYNEKWVVVTVNMYDAILNFFSHHQVIAFNKASVMTNGLGALTALTVPTAFTMVPAITQDRAISDMYFVENFNQGLSSINTRLRISLLTGAVGQEILRVGHAFTTNSANWFGFEPLSFFQAGFAPQLNSSNLIANNDARIQNVVYRNNSLWATHTVFLPAGNPNHSAVQWWQIGTQPTNAAVYQFGRIEDTNGFSFYAFPSLAVNRCNDVLIGYSSFSPNIYASGSYSFRFGDDPPNVMHDPTLLKAGEAPYFKSGLAFPPRNRWGDYSATMVDPLNDLDMWTIQEYAATPDPIFGIDRWGTWWGRVDVANITHCGQIEFASPVFSVNEAAPGFATITVTNLTGAAGTVDFATSDGTAFEGLDYVRRSGTLTFAPGVKSTNFTILILDNGLQDSNRTVNLSLFNATGGASLGTLTNAVVTIIDDEFVPLPEIAGEFNFSTYLTTNFNTFVGFSPFYQVTENETAIFPCGREIKTRWIPDRTAYGAVVTVTRTKGASGRVMVDFATAEGGTAIPGLDYTPTNMTLIFDDYQMSTNIVIPVFNFSFLGGHKFVRLVLSNPRPAPEEEAEQPGVIRPTLGPGSESGIMIFEINNGYNTRFFFFGGVPVGGNSVTNYVPGFAFERSNYRVDEYFGNDEAVNESGGSVRLVNVDVIFGRPPVQMYASAGGSVRLRMNDRQSSVVLLSIATMPGSDRAESPNPPPGGDEFSGRIVYRNPAFSDPTLPRITNHADYAHQDVELNFGSDDCRRRVTLMITNDPHAEFNEDIVLWLDYIDGQEFAPNPFASTCTVTIQFHDQPAGALDREWNPDNISQTTPSFNFVPGANNTVYAVAVQPDGKTLLAGEFTDVNSEDMEHLARLNLDGSVDLSFAQGVGANSFVSAIALYPPTSVHFGKILIAGGFTTWNGIDRRRIARLLPDGQLDTTFNPGTGADGPIRAIALQADGKIIVGGLFSEMNTVPRRNIARLLPDGGLDTTFNAAPGPDATVLALSMVPVASGPEKILLGGDFFTVNGEFNFGVAQLHPNGSLDETFNTGSGANGSVYSVITLSDGRHLVAGAFSTFNDTDRGSIARLMPNGQLDPTFAPPFGANDSIYSMTLQPDNKILIGGPFTQYDRARRMGLARLRPDSSLDTSFMDTALNQFAGFTHPTHYAYSNPNYVNSIAVQPDGHIIVGGSFTNVGGNPSYRHAFRAPHTVFTRADKRVRMNIARLIGGFTHGPGNVSFDASDYSVDENGRTASVRLQRTDGRVGSLLGVAVTQDRIALNGLDYLSATNQNIWDQGIFDDETPYTVGEVSPVFFRIPLLDDGLEEGDELIDLKFLRAEASINLGGEFIPLGGAVGRSAAVLNIADNDFSRGEFNFLISNHVTNESSPRAIITVIRTNGTVGNVSVRWMVVPSTNTPIATPGVDYKTNTLSGILQFTSGQTTHAFQVELLDDFNVEFDENISLVLTNAGGGARLPGGKATSTAGATLTLVDNDFAPGRVNFSSSTFTNSEGDGYASVRVTRSGGSVGTVAVQMRSRDGTAVAPGDYTPVMQTLTWDDLDNAAKTILVPLHADNTVEGMENIRFELFDPRVNGVPDATLLGQRTNALAYVQDSDAYGIVAFTQPIYQADENGATYSVTVIRSAGTAGTISVNYSATADSATAGQDFTPVNGTLTFVPGQFSATFSVPVLDDTVSDGNKIVQLELSNPVNTTLGLLNRAVLVLVDNESVNTPPGGLDTTFDSTTSANGPIYAISQYFTNGIFDGRLIIAGDFTNVNNITRQGIARLHPNGNLDTTFNIGQGPNAPVRALAIQADGRVLLGGFFTQVTGTNRSSIARLNIEGTLDTFFDPGAGADGPIYSIAVQPDQKILAAGAFSTFDTAGRPGMVRLLSNGRLDPGFNAGAGPEGVVFAIALQPDGKILIGGDFPEVDNVPRPRIARLNRNGSLDLSFDAGVIPEGSVRAIVVQPDGRIVIGGAFTSINGVTLSNIARLEINGALDTTFTADRLGANNTVQALGLQADGKIVIAGDFTQFNGVTRNRITRLNTDGSTDTTINFGTGANAFIAALTIQPDRRIVIGGAFTTYDEFPRNRIARIYGGSSSGAGSLEFTTQQFIVSELFTNAIISVRRRGGTTGQVGVNVATADDTAISGRDYVGTNVTVTFPPGEILRTAQVRILLNPAPSTDLRALLYLTNYTGGAAIGSRPTASLIIRNEEALIEFTGTNYVSTEGIPSGLASISVSRFLATNSVVSVQFSATSGSATAGTDFTPTNGVLVFQRGETNKSFLVPILDDTVIESTELVNLSLANTSPNAQLGQAQAALSILDNDFAPGQLFFSPQSYTVDEAAQEVEITILRTNGTRGVVSVEVATSDGTALAGSDYGTLRRIVSLGEDQTNVSFKVAILDDFVVEGNEFFLVSMGNPTGGGIISGPTNALVTVVENDFGPGNLVREFDPGTGANNYVRALALQRDGKIVVGGAFTQFDNTNRNYLTRLHADGSQDLTFAIGNGANALVSSLAMGIDERIFVGGTFTMLNGSPYSRVGRLLTNGAPDPNFNQVPGFNAVVHALAMQSNGHVLVGGNFNLPARSVAQLRVNGSMDSTFVVGSGANNLAHALVTYPDGSAVIGGGFTTFNGFARSRIVRLLANGNVDMNFAPPMITNGVIYALVVEPDGQILIGGDFYMANSASRFSLARLNADGTLDTTFRTNNGINGIVFGIGLQSSGKIVVGGNFTMVDGVSRNRYTRLNPEGTVDETFNPGIGANNTVYAVCMLPDDNILLGGEFTLVNGISRRGVAKIRGNDQPARFYDVNLIGGTARLSMVSTPGVNYVLQASSNLVNWVSLSTNNAPGNTITLVDPDANLHKKRFYRVRQAGQ